MNNNFDFENLEYLQARAKLKERVTKARAKKAKKAMVYKKIRKFINLGLIAIAVVGTLTSAKNFKVAAVRVATNEEVQTLFASASTYSDVDMTSEKENLNQTIAQEEVIVESSIVEESIKEIVVEEEAIIEENTIVEENNYAVEEVVAEEEAIIEEENIAEEVAVKEETVVEEVTDEEEIVAEYTTEDENITDTDDIIIYDKASEILFNATSQDITLTASKASDMMFKSQGGDKTEFSPWEELFGTNVYRYAGLRFNIEAKINADRMSVVSGFDNDFYVVVDNIDREGIEYTISLDVEEIMEMISQNGKTPEETKAIIEKHGDFFKQVIEDSKKDIENRISGSYINGMKTDNEFYRALNKQLSDSLNNEWKVTVLGAEA